MTTHESLLPATVLERKAVVYVRQSTPQQVQSNLEGQHRQYELVEVARRRGFINVEIIDDDLGRSASGSVERSGFDRLVAALCAGQVSAVLCLDASRLARNGRDWHHLLELCGLVEARVIDLDGVYDPCRPNDRLLLGMKGSISEFELGILRSRMYEAVRSKARRGEMRISMPIGYTWDRQVGLGLDPDRRLQEVIRLVFQKFRELGSDRQVLLWMSSENIHFPYPLDGRTLTSFEWRPIRYRNVISILKNPFYAGAYAYGKTEKRTTIVDGRARKSYGWAKPMDAWEVLIKDHHEGYITWASTSTIRYSWPAMLMARSATRSPAAAVVSCWPASSLARDAAVGSQSSTRVGGHGLAIIATSRTSSWGSAGVSGSVADASTTRLQPRCCAPSPRCRSRRLRRLSACSKRRTAIAGALQRWNCSRPDTMRPWRNGAMRRAIRTTG
jgi:DNA invertase Pin-like site-specific DNA recombinase